MNLNLYQVIFLLVLFLGILIIWFKYKKIYLINYILGFVIVHVCTDFYLKNGIFSKGGPRAKEEAILYLANYIFYNILFFSSFFLLLFKKEKWKQNYFIIPAIVYTIILLTFIVFTDFPSIIGTSLFFAFFPLYMFSYYLKFLKNNLTIK